MKKITFPPEIQDELKSFVPEWYQWPVINAIEKDGKKNALLVWNRRAGKDITSLNILIRQALKRRGSYLYMLPQHKQAREVIFDGMTYEGKPLLSYIPAALIARRLEQQMTIHLVNGSIVYFRGSNDYDSYRGISPMGLIMSEAAYSHPMAYQTFVPALERNDAFSILISTPNGYNWFYDLHQTAQKSSTWFTQLLSVEDTKTMSIEQIEQQIKDGKISWDTAQSEYFCRFDIGIEGAYYGRYLQQAYLDGRITNVPYDPKYPVQTAWDLGWNDSTCIVFFQVINNAIHIIDFYENHHKDMTHYIRYVKDKEYVYGTHILPHDVAQTNHDTGTTRLERFQDHNMPTIVLANTSEYDGIDAVRSLFGRLYIDEKKCAHLIKCLENFRKKYDRERKTYYDKPVRDWAKHASDAVRYMAMGWRKVLDNDTLAYDKYNEAWQRNRTTVSRSIYNR